MFQVKKMDVSSNILICKHEDEGYFRRAEHDGEYALCALFNRMPECTECYIAGTTLDEEILHDMKPDVTFIMEYCNPY